MPIFLYVKLAVLAALVITGFLLYKQIEANGELRADVKSAYEKVGRANFQTKLALDQKAKTDAAMETLEINRRLLAKKVSALSKNLEATYNAPISKPWADTPVPSNVSSAAHAAINCLWDSKAPGAEHCGIEAAKGTVNRLPATGSRSDH